MSRLLFLVIIAVAVYLVVKSYRSKRPPENKPLTDDMVQCAHCGVHLPKGESLVVQGQFFCSAAHRDAYRK
jgi:uncharacterized protein